VVVSHVLLYVLFAVWVLATPLLVAAAVVAGFATGRGTALLQSWAYLTLYLVFEVLGTVVSNDAGLVVG
jgi:hypothetical protein